MAVAPPSFSGRGPQVSFMPTPINTAAPIAEGLDAVARATSQAEASAEANDQRARETGLQVLRINRERELQLRGGEIAAHIGDAQGSLITDLATLRSQAAPGAAGYEDQVNERVSKFRDDVTGFIGNDPDLISRYADNVAAIAATARTGEAKWAIEQRAQKSVNDSDAVQNSLQANIRTAIANGTATGTTLSDADALDAKAIAALPLAGNDKEKLLKARHQERLVTAVEATIDVNPNAVLTEIDKGTYGELDDKVVAQLRERARVAADRLENQASQQANAGAATARAEARNVIEDVNGGTLVDTKVLQSYRAGVEGSTKPEDIALAHDLDRAIAKNAVTAKYGQSTQAERVQAMHDIEGTKGWQTNDQLRTAYDQLGALIQRDAHAAEKDPVSLYAAQTTQALPPLNLGDHGAMAKRFVIGDQAAQRFARPVPQHFTEQEADELRQQYNSASADGKAQFIMGLGTYGSRRAREMIYQLAPSKPELSRLAELAASGDPAVKSLVREASDGAAAPAKDGLGGQIKSVAMRDFGPALARMPGDRMNSIVQVATWIYAHRAAQSGKANVIDPDLAHASISAALGGAGGKGGLGQRNGASVVLPMGATQNDFDRLLAMPNPAQFRAAANGVPKWSNRDMTLGEFRNLVPVLIADTGTQTLYAFRSKGGSGFVKTERGDDYVLDTRKLAGVLSGHLRR
jgi:hypothetical protein